MQQYTTLKEIIPLIPFSANLFMWIVIGSIVLVAFSVVLLPLLAERTVDKEERKRLSGATIGFIFVAIWTVCAIIFVIVAPRATNTATQALVSNIQMKYKVASGNPVEQYDVMALKNGSSLDEDSRQIIFNLVLENGSVYPNAVVRFGDDGEPFMTMTGDITEASILRATTP